MNGLLCKTACLRFAQLLQKDASYLYILIYLKVKGRKMSEKLQLKGGISEPGLDIPPNWKDIRTSSDIQRYMKLLA